MKRLYVPFCEKDQVKKLGGKWCMDKKRWECFESDIEEFERWTRPIVLKKADFDNKDSIKQLGGLWVPDAKKWVCLRADEDKFKQYY